LPRSKLEAYEDIIDALSQQALTIDDIAFTCSMNCVNLQQRLDFLVKHNVADIEIGRDNKAFYVLTRRGLTIAKTLAVTKSLEKLQTSSKNATENYLRISMKTDEAKEETAHSF
jgi:predicted transcriptional regulator